MDVMTMQEYIPQPEVVPAQWGTIGELYALLPFMIIFMVMVMVMKIVYSAMKIPEAVAKPEYMREIMPAAKEVAPLLLAGGV